MYLAQHGAEEGSTVYKICYTQWYWGRQVAKSIFYAEANSAAFLNGEQLAATQGVSFSGSVAVDAALNSGSTVLYSIASGNLPAGMTFNTASGAISGTTSEVGTKVDCQASATPKKTSKGVRQPNLLRGL